MCIICVQFHQQKLTLPEARRNFIEMRDTIDNEHAAEVDDMLWAEEYSYAKDLLSDDSADQLDFFDVLDSEYPFYADEYDDDIICSD